MVTVGFAKDISYKVYMERQLCALTGRFFCAIRYHKTGQDPYLFKPDSHDGFDILQVISGEGYFINGKQIYKMRPRHIYFINASTPHYSNPSSVENYVRNTLVMEKSSITGFLKAYNALQLLMPFTQTNSSNQCIYLSEEAHQQINDLFFKIHQEKEQNSEFSNLAIASMCVQLMLLAMRNHVKTDDSLSQTIAPLQHINEILAYIDTHFKDFSLDSMAKELYMSKSYLCHLFKKYVNITIQQYLNSQRLNHACFLLLCTDISISDISSECGYSSHSLFSRTFKKNLGLTPRIYRQSKHKQSFNDTIAKPQNSA